MIIIYHEYYETRITFFKQFISDANINSYFFVTMVRYYVIYAMSLLHYETFNARRSGIPIMAKLLCLVKEHYKIHPFTNCKNLYLI